MKKTKENQYHNIKEVHSTCVIVNSHNAKFYVVYDGYKPCNALSNLSHDT